MKIDKLPIAGIRDETGKLPAFSSVGCYPIFYVAVDGGVMCPACSNGENGSECGNPEVEGDPQWDIAAHDIHWEGEPLTCEHCNADIESAYGPVE